MTLSTSAIGRDWRSVTLPKKSGNVFISEYEATTTPPTQWISTMGTSHFGSVPAGFGPPFPGPPPLGFCSIEIEDGTGNSLCVAAADTRLFGDRDTSRATRRPPERANALLGTRLETLPIRVAPEEVAGLLVAVLVALHRLGGPLHHGVGHPVGFAFFVRVGRAHTHAAAVARHRTLLYDVGQLVGEEALRR